MRKFRPSRALPFTAVAGMVALLSACAQQPAPPLPPPPPQAIVIPPRPHPPMNAPVNLQLPPLQTDGTRFTVNTGVSGAQSVWSLRSAYNVAALNCMETEHASILPGYAAFLKNHAKLLKKVNGDLDRKFRAENGSQYIKVRETYQTQIYNFFAFPPVLPAFCDAAVVLAQDISALAPDQLEGFAPAAVARLDTVFQQFYASYARYQTDLALWEERYGTGPTVAAGSFSSQSLAQ